MVQVLLLDKKSVDIFLKYVNKKKESLKAFRLYTTNLETYNYIISSKRFSRINITMININKLKIANIAKEMAESLCRGIKVVFNDNICHIFENELFLNHLLEVVGIVKVVIDNIENGTFTNLLLVGGSSKYQVHPVFFADGEAPFKILFRRSWGLNNFILQVAKGNPKIKVEWLQESKWKVCFVTNIRLLIITSLRLMAIIRFILFAKSTGDFGLVKKLERFVPIIIRSDNQERFVRRYVASKKGYYIVLIEYSNMSQSQIVNFDNAIRLNSRGIYRIIDLINALTEILFKFFKLFLSVKFDKNSFLNFKFLDYIIGINIRSIYKELIPMQMDYNYRLRKLQQFMKKNSTFSGNFIITTEMIAYGSYIHRLIANVFNKKLITIQCGTMPLYPFPNLHSNKFISFQRSFINVAKKFYPCVDFEYFPNFIADFREEKSKDSSKKTLVVFTQPDNYRYLFEKVIDVLITILREKEEGFNVIIKPHPRDRNKKYYKKIIRNNQSFSISNASVEELCREATVAIISTSTVKYDLLMYNVPIISVLYENDFNLISEKEDFSNEIHYLSLNDVNKLKYLIAKIIS